MNKDQMGKQIHYLDAALKECEAENEKLVVALAESESSNRAHVAELKNADAKIDALMLEYCPDEMTQEQRVRWAAHQVTASDAATKSRIDCPYCRALDVGSHHICPQTPFQSDAKVVE